MAENLLVSWNRFGNGWEILTCSRRCYTPTNRDKLSVNDLPAHFLLELRRFFEDYKRLEHKTVLIDQFQDHRVARDIVQESIALYQHTFRR